MEKIIDFFNSFCTIDQAPLIILLNFSFSCFRPLNRINDSKMEDIKLYFLKMVVIIFVL